MENMANIVAKHKADIFSLLQDNIAEKPEDEKILKDLRDTLNDKKNEFEKDLWKSSNKIDLSKNDELIKFWENKINWSYIWAKSTTKQNDEITVLIKDALDKIQHLDEQNNNWTLFGWKTFDISNIKKNTKLPEISSILNATDTSTLNKNIDNFVKWVRKTKNPFHIQHSKLYTQPIDTQRDVSIRITLYLYFINTMVEENAMTQSLYTKLKDDLENQIINLEISKIKWIYNVKKELENVEPEHETLKDINQKAWDIDFWSEKYWPSNIKKTQNLTTEFENWLATDIETYKIDSSILVTNPNYQVKLRNISGDVTEFSVDKDDFSEVDLLIDVNGKDIKLGKIWIQNKYWWSTDADFNIELDNLGSIKSQLTQAEIASVFPLELDMPVQWIKNVKNPARWKVGLTKDIHIKLDIDGWWPIPYDPIIDWNDLDDELDVNFSDMKQTIKDVANERTYNEDSREYVEWLKNKNTKFGRMLLASKQAMFGDLFRLRKFKKHRKNIDSTKTKLNIRGDRANIAKVHGWQWVKSVMELTQAEYPVVYDKIYDLSYRFYKGWSTMSAWQFETELKQIFDSVDARDLKDDLEAKWVDIDKSASDILMSLEIQKAQNELTYQISQAVDAALPNASSTLNANQAAALSTDIANRCKNFTRNHKIMPQLFQHYNKIAPKWDQLNLNDSYENISTHLVAHLDSLSMVMEQSMTNKVKLNIKFLAKWHSTDYVEAKKWERQKRWNPLSRLWNTMYANGYKWRRFPTKVLATWGTAALSTVLLGPIWWIVAGSLVAGSLASGKKAAQVQRKKHSIEREYIKDRKNQTDIANEEDLLKLQYLKDIWNYEDIKTEMDRLLSQSSFSQKDKDDLFWLLSRIIAWLDHQKKTGHNAFSIDETVNWSRPEQIEIQKDANYNKAMSNLHKLKDLAFKRLQLDNVNLDEDDIRSDMQYQSYSSGYKWDFKKFLKLFKKDRRKETRKTWARTAAIYGAVWWITAGIAHFIDAAWSEEVAVAAAERTGDMTTWIEDLWTADVLYELWKFDAGSELSNEIWDQLSSLPANATKIQVDYFAWVDGTPAYAASFIDDMVQDQAKEIFDLLDSGSFSQATVESAQKVISDNGIDSMIDFSKGEWADIGNRNLFAIRNLEWVHELLKQIDGKNIDVEFNFDQSDSIIWDASYVPNDRLSGLDIKAVVDEVPDDIEPPTWWWGEWRAWQWVYNEDNKHKGQENI